MHFKNILLLLDCLQLRIINSFPLLHSGKSKVQLALTDQLAHFLLVDQLFSGVIVCQNLLWASCMAQSSSPVPGFLPQQPPKPQSTVGEAMDALSEVAVQDLTGMFLWQMFPVSHPVQAYQVRPASSPISDPTHRQVVIAQILSSPECP